mmetsp:Transcript_8415/g.21484  ORF Transcript_8415/g.21484 Transcript_8415/m.21484 type:complete len:400 (-) Transcript_8415:867-2066(-)
MWLVRGALKPGHVVRRSREFVLANTKVRRHVGVSARPFCRDVLPENVNGPRWPRGGRRHRTNPTPTARIVSQQRRHRGVQIVHRDHSVAVPSDCGRVCGGSGGGNNGQVGIAMGRLRGPRKGTRPVLQPVVAYDHDHGGRVLGHEPPQEVGQLLVKSVEVRVAHGVRPVVMRWPNIRHCKARRASRGRPPKVGPGEVEGELGPQRVCRPVSSCPPHILEPAKDATKARVVEPGNLIKEEPLGPIPSVVPRQRMVADVLRKRRVVPCGAGNIKEPVRPAPPPGAKGGRHSWRTQQRNSCIAFAQKWEPAIILVDLGPSVPRYQLAVRWRKTAAVHKGHTPTQQRRLVRDRVGADRRQRVKLHGEAPRSGPGGRVALSMVLTEKRPRFPKIAVGSAGGDRV